MIHQEEKNQLPETDPDATKMVELIEQELKQLTRNMSKKVEERLGVISRDMENVKKKNQTQNMKNSKSEIKINTGQT